MELARHVDILLDDVRQLVLNLLDTIAGSEDILLAARDDDFAALGRLVRKVDARVGLVADLANVDAALADDELVVLLVDRHALLRRAGGEECEMSVSDERVRRALNDSIRRVRLRKLASDGATWREGDN